MAKEALKEQEAFMELVVQESRRLQQEAEANAQVYCCHVMNME